jgi:hypothetical protein
VSGPFRSDDEQIREQLRRVEEEVRALEDTHADLQRALELRGRRRPWIQISLVAIVMSLAVGYKVGHLDASNQDARDLAAMHQEAFDSAAKEHADLLDCEKAQAFTMETTAECRRDLQRLSR